MLTILLTRHGLTERSDPEQHLGQRIDAPLSDAGRVAAQALGVRLEHVPVERVIASPLARAFDTAKIAVPGLPIETDPRLMEMDYGEWEGLTDEQIDARFAERRRAFELDPALVSCPGGESGRDVARRVGHLFDDLRVWATDGPEDHLVLLVAHSTLNRILLCVALDVPVKDYRRRFLQSWANLTVLRLGGHYGSGAQLLLGNDV
jgi:broad specificity phosphatase PhoE